MPVFWFLVFTVLKLQASYSSREVAPEWPLPNKASIHLKRAAFDT